MKNGKLICLIVCAVLQAPRFALGEPPSSSRCDFSGVVDCVKPDKHVIVVRSGKRDNYQRRTITFDRRTEIVRSRRPFEPKNIRVDMRIWVYLRKDGKGDSSDVARRLTLSDPYPDLYGTIEKVDAGAGTITILRAAAKGDSADARHRVTVRVDTNTQIRMNGESASLSQVPANRRVAITSVRDDNNQPTSLAAKLTVRRPLTESKRNPPDSKDDSKNPREDDPKSDDEPGEKADD